MDLHDSDIEEKGVKPTPAVLGVTKEEIKEQSLGSGTMYFTRD